MFSMFLCLLLCVHHTLAVPINNHQRDFIITQDDEADKSDSSNCETEKDVSGTTPPSTTFASNIGSTESEPKDGTKQPSSKAQPTVTPAKPMEHMSNSPTPLGIKSVTPIKSMSSKSEEENPNNEPGCIDICHNTEIQPAPDTVPCKYNEEVDKVIPSLPDMIKPLKDKEPGSCCVWRCGKCNVTICKTSKSNCPQIQEENCSKCPCQVKNEKCAEVDKEPCTKEKSDGDNSCNDSGCIDICHNTEIHPAPDTQCQTNKDKCSASECQTTNKAAESANMPYNIQVVQALEKCPVACTNPPPTCTNCPSVPVCPPNQSTYFPPCITCCNNNYLGNNLVYGGKAPTDEGVNNAGTPAQTESMETRQPTTRKVSTVSPLAGMKPFTNTAPVDSGMYNPIQAMQPVLGQDDLIIHQIFMAEPYTPQNPSSNG